MDRADERWHDWIVSLSNRWQFATGLRHGARRQEVQSALEMLLELRAEPSHPVDQLLVRGYVLELAAVLTNVSGCVPIPIQVRLRTLSDTLCERRFPNADATRQVEALIADMRRLPNSGRSLAQLARAIVETSNGRYRTVAYVSGKLCTNTGYLSRAFRREFGMSLAQYQQRRRAAVTIGALTAGASIKETAFQNHCTAATLRRLVRAATGGTPSNLKPKNGGLREVPGEAFRAGGTSEPVAPGEDQAAVRGT